MIGSKGSSDQPFSKRALVILITLGVLSTIGVAVTSVFVDDGRYQTSSGSNSFSKSALGHAALVELLRREGYQTIVSQFGTSEKIGNDSALLLLEPWNRSAQRQHANDMLFWAPTLVVLPKRRGVSMGARRGWISRDMMMGAAEVAAIARLVFDDAELIRPDHSDHEWQHDFDLAGAPEIDDLQLFSSETAEAIIETADGILLGRYVDPDPSYPPVYVLSDPDLLATHGLARGWNAEYALSVIEQVMRGRSTLIVDEIIHGYSMEPSLARSLVRQPFIYGTVAALLALVVFLLTFTRRFGAPSRVENSLQDSKSVFIENTARILHLADKEKEALLRLMDDQALMVAERLNAPKDLAKKDLIAWLDETCRLREIAPDFGTIRLRVERNVADDDSRAVRLLHQASQFYSWKQEILNDTK